MLYYHHTEKLTRKHLNKLRKLTGLAFEDSSYKNDLCDSAYLQTDKYNIYVYFPNTAKKNPKLENEEFNTFSIRVQDLNDEDLTASNFVYNTPNEVAEAVKQIIERFYTKEEALEVLKRDIETQGCDTDMDFDKFMYYVRGGATQEDSKFSLWALKATQEEIIREFIKTFYSTYNEN